MIAVGIDVGYTATRRSTGVVVLRDDPVLFVDTAENAVQRLRTELRGGRARICIDGPLQEGPRLVESVLCRGPFASSRGLRLCPMPTRPGSPFLAATLRIVRSLRQHEVNEIFPTLFMASLLPPHRYEGARSQHTDELWLRLRGHPFVPAALYERVERAPRGELHDLRAAAIAALAAARSDLTRLSSPGDGGLVLPPLSFVDPAFHAMLQAHLTGTGTHWQ